MGFLWFVVFETNNKNKMFIDNLNFLGRIPGQKLEQNNQTSTRHAVISRRIQERRNELIVEEEELTDSLNVEQLTNAYNRLMK